MTRRARAAALGALLLLPVLTATPALAAPNDQLGPQEGADLVSGLSTGETLLLFVAIPLAILLGVALLVLLPGIVKADRYRPNKGWSAAPIWFAGPPDPVAAVETADVSGTTRGGASGDW